MNRSLSAALALLCLMLLGGCLQTGSTRSPQVGESAYTPPTAKQGLQRIREGNGDFQRANRLLATAQTARKAGDLPAARSALQQLLELEPDNTRAQTMSQQLSRAERHQTLLAEASTAQAAGDEDTARRALREVLIEDPGNSEAKTLLRSINQQNSRDQITPRKLKPHGNTTLTLDFRDANLRSIFEVISKTSGINFVLDPSVRNDLTASIFVKDASVEDVIDFLLLLHQLNRKVLTENALLIFPAVKAAQYEDLILRSYYLNYADAKQTAALVKSVMPIKDVHVDEKLNMLSLKATYEQLRDIDRLIADSDLADPEIVLDVEILEVRSSRLSDIGVIFPDTFSVLPSADTLTLDDINNANSTSVGVSPSLALRLLRQDGESNLLANPRIRVKSREKAKIHIGDKIPIPVTTIGSGNNNFVGQSANYLDVGLKLDVEPRVLVGNEVNIRVSLEVSSATFTAGSVFPTIGTRNTSTVMMTADGETQILAGLINDEDRRNTRRLPGLGDLPLLGRLFSEPNINKAKTEIVLLITPHVVRNIQRPDADNAEFYAGTGSQRAPAAISPAASVQQGTVPAVIVVPQTAPAAGAVEPALPPGLRAPLGRPVGDD